MKLVCLFLMAGCLLLTGGCSSQGQDDAAVSGVTVMESGKYDLTSAMAEMLESYPIDEPLELGEADLAAYFGIDASLVESFAATICGMGITADEYILITAADEAAVKTVEECLMSRLESRKTEFETYIPEEYAVLEQCKVETFGSTVTLLVSEHRDELVSILASHQE